MPMPVKRIILGTMTFGNRGYGNRVQDPETARRMLDRFAEAGHSEVDTCYVYGDGSCEQMLGDLGAGGRFAPAIRFDPVATPRGHEPDVLGRSVRASLARLGVDRADLLYLSARDARTPWESTLRAVHELHGQGLFGELGLSNLSIGDVEESLDIADRSGWVRPTVYQGLYNAVSRTAEIDLLPRLHDLGLRFHAYNPLVGGAFAPGFGKEADVAVGSRFDADHPQGAFYRKRYWNDPYLCAMRELHTACGELGLPPTAAALRWLVHHSPLDAAHGDGIILGASSTAQLAENLTAVQGGPLPQAALDAIETASETTRPSWPPVSLTI